MQRRQYLSSVGMVSALGVGTLPIEVSANSPESNTEATREEHRLFETTPSQYVVSPRAEIKTNKEGGTDLYINDTHIPEIEEPTWFDWGSGGKVATVNDNGKTKALKGELGDLTIEEVTSDFNSMMSHVSDDALYFVEESDAYKIPNINRIFNSYSNVNPQKIDGFNLPDSPQNLDDFDLPEPENGGRNAGSKERRRYYVTDNVFVQVKWGKEDYARNLDHDKPFFTLNFEIWLETGPNSKEQLRNYHVGYRLDLARKKHCIMLFESETSRSTRLAGERCFGTFKNLLRAAAQWIAKLIGPALSLAAAVITTISLIISGVTFVGLNSVFPVTS